VKPEFNALRQFYEHTDVPRPMSPPNEEICHEYPHTLDLRKRDFQAKARYSK